MTRSARLIGSPLSFVVLTMLLVSNPLLCCSASAQVTDQAQGSLEAPVPPSNAPAASDGAESSAGADSSPQEPTRFTYNSQDRRDPFVSLVGWALRPAGLAGLAVAEVALRGTMTSREGFVGVVLGADQRTYIVRAGDTLLDGVVQSISLNDMVILQEVNDPLSLETEREVRKLLRQIEAN